MSKNLIIIVCLAVSILVIFRLSIVEYKERTTVKKIINNNKDKISEIYSKNIENEEKIKLLMKHLKINAPLALNLFDYYSRHY